MAETTPRPEFNVISGGFSITCIDYCWKSAGNPEGSLSPEAGIKNIKTGEFHLCQHGMNHERAVAMIVSCLEHGVSAYETAEHVQRVGNRYHDSRWGGDNDDWDWQRPKPEEL